MSTTSPIWPGTGRRRDRGSPTTRTRRQRHARRADAAAAPRTRGTRRSSRPSAACAGRDSGCPRHRRRSREADVVELDLVEARLRGRRGNVDVVLPRSPRIRIEPAEAGVRTPDRAARRVDRQLRMRDRRDRILERDDATDEVEAGAVDALHDGSGVVVRPRCSVGDGECRRALVEPERACLVLDVELDRGSVLPCEARCTTRACRQARARRARRGSPPGAACGTGSRPRPMAPARATRSRDRTRASR